MKQRITDKAREVAAEEVLSLLDNGYRSYGVLRLKQHEAYFLRHQTNGNKAVVVLKPYAVQLVINGYLIQTTPTK